MSIRQVKRLLYGLKKHGDKAVIHGLRGQAIEPEDRQSDRAAGGDDFVGAGVPGIRADVGRGSICGKNTGLSRARRRYGKWMMRASYGEAKAGKVRQVHTWRPRRSRFGELVQWDTSEHDWLEGRGEKLYLIAMIDDATSRLFARFVRHDSTEENMKLLWSYLEKFGRPLAFYTDKASLFQTAEKRKRDEPGVEKDPVEMPPTQIGRALGLVTKQHFHIEMFGRILERMTDLTGITRRFTAVQGVLDERFRRLVAAAESKAIGRGGVSAVARATGMSRQVIRQGMAELSETAIHPPGRVRRPGGGRKKTVSPGPDAAAGPGAIGGTGHAR